MEKKYYLIEVEGAVAPYARGPFNTENEQGSAAKQIHARQDDDDCLFWADIDENGELTVGSYTAGFFLDDREDAVS